MRGAQDRARSARWECAREAGRFLSLDMIEKKIMISFRLGLPNTISIQYKKRNFSVSSNIQFL